MSTEIIFILSLHSIAAIIAVILAIREGLGFLECLRWGALGFITGLLGIIAHARVDRRQLYYMQIVQDAFLNLGMEAAAIYGIPYFLK
jgi:hypothetical protein